MQLISSPVTLEDQSWICAGAFVGPGVTVGEGGVVGAMSVVTRDIEAWTVHAGNPARMIKRRRIRSGETLSDGRPLIPADRFATTMTNSSDVSVDLDAA